MFSGMNSLASRDQPACHRRTPCGTCLACVRRKRRQRLRQQAEQLADSQSGVLSRRQLFGLGYTHWQIAAELRARRWAVHGRQTIAVQTGRLSDPARWWSSVFEVGSGAALDGVTALAAAGLTGFEDAIHVSAPKSARPRRPPGVVVHETRRRRPDDVVPTGIPRTRPAVAAVRAALWARSDKQAALVLAMAVQQRLVTVDAVVDAFGSVLRHRRRRMIGAVLSELAGGAQSIGELEFARLCRESGLPAPDRQSRRTTPAGTVYLDCEWSEYGVVVEVEGAHHLSAHVAIADSIRQNELTLTGDHVLRIPVVGLRSDPATYLGQVARMLRVAGWRAA